MKPIVNLDRVAKGLGAERRGKVIATSGYFGAMDLAAEIQARFQVPRRGGRATDPQWTARRQVPFASRTLERLQDLAAAVEREAHVHVEPLQLAGLLLERVAREITEAEASGLVRSAKRRRVTHRPSPRTAA